MDAKLKPLLEKAAADKKVPCVGAFIVDRKGNFLLKEAFGSTTLAEPNAPSFDADTLLAIFSCTKIITTIAALQLIEQGKLSLDDPVEKYVPQIKNVQVHESMTMSADGKPDIVLRAPKTQVTVRHLITHTAGFTYDFFDQRTLAYRMFKGQAPMQYQTTGVWADFETPLVSDPGTKYVYGIAIDWLGWVIEKASGENLRLKEHLAKHVLEPLGMHDTSPINPPEKKSVDVHFDLDENGPVAHPEMKFNEDPPLWSGGGFLLSTMNDYAKLLVTLLNDGTSPTTGKSILKPETVKNYIFKDQLGPEVDRSDLGVIYASIPLASVEGTLLPSLSAADKGWSAGLLLNFKDLPYGRKAGSGAWAGLGNLYYWIDPKTGIAGFICTSVFPFLQPTMMYLFDEMERVAYGHDIAGEGSVEDDKRNYKAKA